MSSESQPGDTVSHSTRDGLPSTARVPARPVQAGLRAWIGVRRADLNIDVEVFLTPGSTLALLGPNGAGKSTIIRSITGLLPLEHGFVELNDRLLDCPDRSIFVPVFERQIGVLFQQDLLLEHLNVTDNVAFGLRSQGKGRREARKEAESWLDRLSISHLAGSNPTALSGGQSRRVAIARALAGSPQLIILDEPFAGLDATAKGKLVRVLREHLDQIAVPILLVVHDPYEAEALADWVAVVQDGSISQQGKPASLRRAPESKYVADLVGTNLIMGHAKLGVVAVSGASISLAIVDRNVAGPVAVTVPPTGISLYREQPAGSPRNSWKANVSELHPVGHIVRVFLDEPIPICADVTRAAVEDLGIHPGQRLWVSLKATGMAVTRTQAT